MELKNSNTRFGLISILLHWVMGLLIIALLCIGFYMTSMPDVAQQYDLYGWHKAFGILVLILAIIRVAWHICSERPALLIPAYERILARTTHGLLYTLMIIMPLSGWFMSSAAGKPPSFFGLFTLPALVEKNKALSKLFSSVHEWVAYCLIALIILHILGALKHHFIDKNDILKRII